MSDDKTYITYPGGDKIDIMDVDEPLLLDEMVEINKNIDINKIKAEIKSRVDKIADYCVEKRGPIKDVLSVVSCGPNELERVQSPVWENIENKATGVKYIRYGRSIEFI